MAFLKLEHAFQRYIGPGYADKLKSLVSNKPAILLGGDQLTGKSTMGRKLALHLPGGSFFSVGTMFRELAAKNGVSVAEQSRLLLAQLQDPNTNKRFDVDLDYSTCEIIGGKSFSSSFNIIEGRQPAIMGLFMQDTFGKQNIFRIYLTCSPRERAIRFIDREFGATFSEVAEKNLPLQHNAYAYFSSIGKLIAKLEMPNRDRIAAAFIDNQRRDLDDRTRYKDLYGMDYRDLSHYNLVVDTSGKTAEENFKFALSQIELRDPHFWAELNKST